MHSLTELVLSIVDDDIANEYRKLGDGHFYVSNIAKIQICRDLNKLVKLLNDKKIDNSCQSGNSCSNRKDQV